MSQWDEIKKELEDEEPKLKELLKELDKEYELIRTGLMKEMREELNNAMRNCPDCGFMLEHEGGCVTCRACGYSKCG